ncbi:MAG: excisionase [Butyrivibrio sp.]|uniref:excisionase n=1 Tax=Butyrivibrio sp. TaxID=28121 RepID=UPI001B1FFA67|nr:excisionase [Butyrivibrio sp.]MBO6240754.1 excisionase [Butyrivibrio sp.]
MEKQERVPLWNKYMLTVSEASEVFNIGENKLRFIIENNEGADFIMMNGNRNMIKRKLFEEYLDKTGAI